MATTVRGGTPIDRRAPWQVWALVLAVSATLIGALIYINVHKERNSAGVMECPCLRSGVHISYVDRVWVGV